MRFLLLDAWQQAVERQRLAAEAAREAAERSWEAAEEQGASAAALKMELEHREREVSFSSWLSTTAMVPPRPRMLLCCGCGVMRAVCVVGVLPPMWPDERSVTALGVALCACMTGLTIWPHSPACLMLGYIFLGGRPIYSHSPHIQYHDACPAPPATCGARGI